MAYCTSPTHDVSITHLDRLFALRATLTFAARVTPTFASTPILVCLMDNFGLADIFNTIKGIVGAIFLDLKIDLAKLMVAC